MLMSASMQEFSKFLKYYIHVTQAKPIICFRSIESPYYVG